MNIILTFDLFIHGSVDYYRDHTGIPISSHSHDVDYCYPIADFGTQKESLKKLKQQQVVRCMIPVWLDGEHHH